MRAYKKHPPKEEDNLVTALLRQPGRHLEEKIRELETEIGRRRLISDDILSNLGTHRLQLLDETFRVRYTDILGAHWRARFDIKREIRKLEELMADETLLCFKDISWLREKIREAKAALEGHEIRERILDESEA